MDCHASLAMTGVRSLDCHASLRSLAMTKKGESSFESRDKGEVGKSSSLSPPHR